MSYIYTNLNPQKKLVEDCVIRAISLILGTSWNTTIRNLTEQGIEDSDLPNANQVWDHYLMKNGFIRGSIRNTCPLCYTVRQFTEDHPRGYYIVSDGSHVIAVINGDYYDTFDSGDRTVLYFYERRK